MKKISLHIILILLLSLHQSCLEDLEKCQRRNGQMVEINYELPAITGIDANDGIDIFLHKSSEQKVIVRAGENVIPQISLEVKEGILIVQDNNKCDWSRQYQDREVHLYLPKLISIYQNGYGSISSTDTISTRNLLIEARQGIGVIDIKVKGTKAKIVSSRYGTITLEGEVNQLSVQYLSNNAIFEGRKLKAEHIHIFQKSNNDFHLNPMSSLRGKLLLRGNVYLYHKPEEVDVSITGRGKIIPMYQEE